MLQFRFLKFGQRLIEQGAWFLAPFSFIWGAVSFCKNFLYDQKWLKIHKVDCAVVSIGNLVAGGTGKTPLAHFLAKRFSHRKVAILSRMSDEAHLLARRLPQVRVYIGKDRAALARQALLEGAELILLDDGFQHRRLHRDFDLVALDGKDPFGRGHFLPWGFLRDSPKRLKEADATFVQDGKFEGAIKTLPKVARILDLKGKEIPTIRGMSLGLFCGIAKPEKFKKTVADLGGKTVLEWILADHEPVNEKKLASFTDQCKALGATTLITTEKDFIKLPKGLDLPILFLEIELEIVSGEELWEKLVEKIDRKIDNYPIYAR
jgi:tetraacyldisaccharide 4'-kinase